MNRHLQFSTFITLVLASAAAAGSGHALLPQPELVRRMAVFGQEFLVTPLDGPVIEDPADWVQRQSGPYTYRYVDGTDDGALEQTELQIPDTENPDRAWQRKVGDDLLETFVQDESADILIVEEIDLERGFRIVIRPGVHLPAGAQPGDSWETRSELEVYELDSDEAVRRGRLDATITYEGAFRINTPAGVFDTVLIREDFKLDIGPLSADDDRFMFFARGVGLVAEIEGVKATAMLIISLKDESAKVLVDYPATEQSGRVDAPD